MRAGWAAILALAAGCASGEVRFGAADGGKGSAYYYEIEAGGRNWGDVKVWSLGARAPDDGVPSVEVGFRIRADADQPLEFELAGTYAEIGRQGRFERVHPMGTPSSTLRVAPGAVETAVLRFPLPRPMSAGDVEEVEVDWAVRTPAGRVTHASVFLPVVEARSGYHHPGYGWGHRYPYGYWGDPFYWP